MLIKSVQPSIHNNARKDLHPKKQVQPNSPSFTGFNPVVGLMDVIAAGGFIAAFMIQDTLGFMTPRIYKGLMRKPVDPKTGEVDKNAGLNWDYARKEGLREILTGPATYLAPLGVLALAKKHSGTANNVKMDYIKTFGDSFSEFLKESPNVLNAEKINKTPFYEKIYKNMLDTSINSHLVGDEKLSDARLSETAKSFAEKQTKMDEIAEQIKGKSIWKRSDRKVIKEAKKAISKLKDSVTDDFIKLKKSSMSASTDLLHSEMKILGKNKTANDSISDIPKHIKNYTHDAFKNVKKALLADSSAEVGEVVNKFTNRRLGTRAFSNLGMVGGVIAAFLVIPKLYNLGLKHNPTLAKNSVPSDKTQDKKGKDVAFSGKEGIIEKTGTKIFNHPKLKYISDIFEFNGAQTSPLAMLTLLYGACIPPRLATAQDKYDYNEIIMRDASSFFALMFGANALSRVFSDGFTKLSGFALNSRPEQEGRSIFKKVYDYFDLRGGVSVFDSKRLTSNYTNLEEYKGGINGFAEFIEHSGGNLKKFFSFDKTVKGHVEDIIGKDIKNATADEIKKGFKTASETGSDSLKKIYEVFAKSDNRFLKRARTYNSMFGFLSTIVLTPVFIAWIADRCDKMTQRRAAKDASINANKAEPSQQPEVVKHSSNTLSNKPTMAGFLNK